MFHLSWFIFIKFLFSILFISVLAYTVHKKIEFPDIVNVFMYYGMGVFFLLIFLSLFYEISKFSLEKIPVDEGRRNAIKSFLDISFVIMSVLYFFKAFAYSLKQPTLVKTKIPLGLNGFSILQISDLHIGETIKKDYVFSISCKNKCHKNLI